MLTTGIVAVACALALQVEGAHSTQKGDGGEAVGIGQMHVEAVQEVNRILGYQAFKLADRENPAKVRDMMAITLSWHHLRHPGLSVVSLASRWRNPYPSVRKCPAWHLRRLKEANKKLRLAG